MKRKFKIISLVTTLIMALGVLVSCSAVDDEKNENTLDTIKERGAIRIAVFSDKPPFGYIDSEGNNSGYDVEIGKKIAKDLLGDESKVEFVLTEAASRTEVLQSDKVDITLANFTVTDERKEKVDFAKPYMKVSLGVVSKDGTIKSIDDLKGKTVIVNKGTTAESYFTKNYPDIKLLKFDQNTEAFEALKDGRGDALAHDNTLLFAWAKENKGFSVGINNLGQQDVIAPAVKKGNDELLNWLNDEIDKLASNGEIKEAYNKTLRPVYGDEVKAEDIIVE